MLGWAVLAFVDESYEVGPTGSYVLAAVVADDAAEALRDRMRAAREPWQSRTHFHDVDEKRARVLLDTVRRLEAPLLAVVGRSCLRPERARAKCLERLVWESRSIHGLVIESRGAGLDRMDRRVLAGVQPGLGRRLTYRFELGRDEPLLWAADILASAVFRAYCRDTMWVLDDLGSAKIVEV